MNDSRNKLNIRISGLFKPMSNAT